MKLSYSYICTKNDLKMVNKYYNILMISIIIYIIYIFRLLYFVFRENICYFLSRKKKREIFFKVWWWKRNCFRIYLVYFLWKSLQMSIDNIIIKKDKINVNYKILSPVCIFIYVLELFMSLCISWKFYEISISYDTFPNILNVYFIIIYLKLSITLYLKTFSHVY